MADRLTAVGLLLSLDIFVMVTEKSPIELKVRYLLFEYDLSMVFLIGAKYIQYSL